MEVLSATCKHHEGFTGQRFSDLIYRIMEAELRQTLLNGGIKQETINILQDEEVDPFFQTKSTSSAFGAQNYIVTYTGSVHLRILD